MFVCTSVDCPRIFKFLAGSNFLLLKELQKELHLYELQRSCDCQILKELQQELQYGDLIPPCQIFFLLKKKEEDYSSSLTLTFIQLTNLSTSSSSVSPISCSYSRISSSQSNFSGSVALSTKICLSPLLSGTSTATVLIFVTRAAGKPAFRRAQVRLSKRLSRASIVRVTFQKNSLLNISSYLPLSLSIYIIL